MEAGSWTVLIETEVEAGRTVVYVLTTVIVLAAEALATDKIVETKGLATTETTLVTVAMADTVAAAAGAVIVTIDVTGFKLVVVTATNELDELVAP